MLIGCPSTPSAFTVNPLISETNVIIIACGIPTLSPSILYCEGNAGLSGIIK